MIKQIMGAAALAFALAATPAHAGPVPAAGVSTQDVVNWLNKNGLVGKIKTGVDDPTVSAVTAGINWDAVLLDCDKGTPVRCGSIQFSAGWNGVYTPTQVNTWNRDWRFMKAYATADGKAVWVQMDFNLMDGQTYEEMDGALSFWQKYLPDFTDEVGNKSGG